VFVSGNRLKGGGMSEEQMRERLVETVVRERNYIYQVIPIL
jgi:hypothetical protein